MEAGPDRRSVLEALRVASRPSSTLEIVFTRAVPCRSVPIVHHLKSWFRVNYALLVAKIVSRPYRVPGQAPTEVREGGRPGNEPISGYYGASRSRNAFEPLSILAWLVRTGPYRNLNFW